MRQTRCTVSSPKSCQWLNDVLVRTLLCFGIIGVNAHPHSVAFLRNTTYYCLSPCSLSLIAAMSSANRLFLYLCYTLARGSYYWHLDSVISASVIFFIEPPLEVGWRLCSVCRTVQRVFDEKNHSLAQVTETWRTLRLVRSSLIDV